MRLRGLVSHIEGRFPTKEGLAMNLCQTGDRYVTIGIPKVGVPGVIDPGVLARPLPSEQRACAAALEAFDSYAEGKDGVLYWRARPMLNRYAVGCVIQMRLVISAAPERWRHVNDFIAQEVVACI